MYKRSLPATYASGENKGKPAEVQIANESLGFPADVRDKEGNVTEKRALRIPQVSFVYPQFGPEPKTETKVTGEGENKKEVVTELALTEEEARAGIEEAIVDAGGAVAFLAIHNDNTRDEAVKEAKTYIRQFEGQADTNVKEVVAAGLRKSEQFTWKTAEKITVQQFKQELAQLQAQNIDDMDPAELKARMKKLLGQT